MATKKKIEETKTETKSEVKTVKAVKVAAKKVAKSAAKKTAEEANATQAATAEAEKPAKKATKKIVDKVAKKPSATEEKMAAKAAPAKRTRKTVAKTDKANEAVQDASEVKVVKRTRTAKAKKVEAVEKVAETVAKKVLEKAAKTTGKVAAAEKSTAAEALPQSFDAEYLVLMQKDPNWMQAFWEVSEKRIKAAKKGKGKLVLRLFDIANDLTVKRNKKLKFHDIVVPADARSWYVENKSSNNCKAALGVVSGSKFEPIVEAGPMQTFTLAGSEVNTDNIFVRASLGGAAIGGFGSSGLSSMSAKNWLENALNGLSSSSGSMFSGALSSAALKSNKLELPKDSVNYGKDFFLWVKTRLIVYGGTRPDAHLQVRGEPFPLNPDGTFSFEEDLPDVTKIIPVFATDKDGDFPTTIVPIVVKRTE